MPVHAGSPYWTAVDFDSEGDEEPSPGSSRRLYVDPWDSEQYSFGRSDPGEPARGEHSNSLAGEPVSASFYYVPTKSYESDEETGGDEGARRTLAAEEEASPAHAHAQRGRRSRQHLADHPEMINYGYDVMPIQRRVSVYSPEEAYYGPYEPLYQPLPTLQPAAPAAGAYLPPPGPRKRVSLPAPRADYVAASNTPHHHHHRRPSRYADACERYAYESLVSEYGAAEEWERCRRAAAAATAAAAAAAVPKAPPGNFHLSRYGHLKIDYSCSWSSLDRLIRNQ